MSLSLFDNRIGMSRPQVRVYFYLKNFFSKKYSCGKVKILNVLEITNRGMTYDSSSLVLLRFELLFFWSFDLNLLFDRD